MARLLENIMSGIRRGVSVAVYEAMETRQRSNYISAVNTMAKYICEDYGWLTSFSCLANANDLNSINYKELCNFLSLYESSRISDEALESSYSIKTILSEYYRPRVVCTDCIEAYISDNFDALSPEEEESVYDDFEADSIINKNYYGGGAYESKIDFINLVKQKIYEDIKRRFGKS